MSNRALMNGKMATFSTSDENDAKKFDYWQEIVCKRIVNVECRPNQATLANFNGRLNVGVIGNCSFFEMHSDPVEFVRTKENVAQQPDDSVLVTMRLTNSSKKLVNNSSTIVGTGDLSFYHCGREQQLSILGEVNSLGLVIPVEKLLDYIRSPEDLNAKSIKRSTAVGGLLATQFESIARYCFNLPEHIQANVLQSFLSIMPVAWNADPRRNCMNSVDLKPALFKDIDAYIRDNICLEKLSPEHIARVKNISIRYLYYIFREMDTTPAEHIRNTRLEEVRKRLSISPPVRISVLSDRYGFRSISSLSKAFRSKYGVSPREYQKYTCSRKH